MFNSHKLLMTIFCAALLFTGASCKKEPPIVPPEPPPVELDSVSHDFSWEIDTLGGWQSGAIGVWGTSPTNVYVAGDFLDEVSFGKGTNVMHWDGKKWSMENFYEGEIISIFGFSENDIWVAGSYIVDPNYYPLFGHWDGKKWEKTVIWTKGQIVALWGTSSKDLFAVGGSGIAYHFDGLSWTAMASNSNKFLHAMWGVSHEMIYAVGEDAATGGGSLLFFDGISWSVLYDRLSTIQEEPRGKTTAVWMADSANVYIGSSSGIYKGSRMSWQKMNALTENIYVETIRGSSRRNVFIAGDFGLLVHWDGYSWHRYDQFYRFNEGRGDNLYGVWAYKKNVFVVGRSETARAIVYRGTQ